MKILWLLVLAIIAWRLFFGRWPWQPKSGALQSQSESEARNLLGVEQDASRQEIIDAHRRRVAVIHPDRGGRNEDVHQADAARDLLLAGLANHDQEQI